MLTPAETSFFSAPSLGLDPRLFKSGKLDTSIRSSILSLLLNQLDKRYTGASAWTTAWLAGSGVSFNWTAQRDPADLDCIVGINYPSFRAANPNYRGLSDAEIASMLNDEFHQELQPATEEFLGVFELTFFAITATDIMDIKPYAAYSLTDDLWVVPPQPTAPERTPEWDAIAAKDKTLAVDILSRYIAAKNKFESSTNAGLQANARSEMRVALSQGASMYDTIHSERSQSFSMTGKGYRDFPNYRWQAGKESGVVQALKGLKKKMASQDAEFAQKTYGVDLPSTNTLIRRAATR